MTLSAIYAANPHATAVRRSTCGAFDVRVRPALRGALVIESRIVGHMFWSGYGLMAEDQGAEDWQVETGETERRAA